MEKLFKVYFVLYRWFLRSFCPRLFQDKIDSLSSDVFTVFWSIESSRNCNPPEFFLTHTALVYARDMLCLPILSLDRKDYSAIYLALVIWEISRDKRGKDTKIRIINEDGSISESTPRIDKPDLTLFDIPKDELDAFASLMVKAYRCSQIQIYDSQSPIFEGTSD